MTKDDAKRELKPIKEMESDIRAYELEIERLMTVATKMTPNYSPMGSPSNGNKLEEAVIKMDEYKNRLTNAIMESLIYKNECLNKVQKMQHTSLRKILILYYFHNMTLEKVAETIGKSYRWTYTMFEEALDEYSQVS